MVASQRNRYGGNGRLESTEGIEERRALSQAAKTPYEEKLIQPPLGDGKTVQEISRQLRVPTFTVHSSIARLQGKVGEQVEYARGESGRGAEERE